MLPLNVLSEFLRKVADDIDCKTVNEVDLQLATEHFISHHFSTSAPVPEDLAKKYITMGWYIYTQLHADNDKLKSKLVDALETKCQEE